MFVIVFFLTLGCFVLYLDLHWVKVRQGEERRLEVMAVLHGELLYRVAIVLVFGFNSVLCNPKIFSFM